MAGRVFAGVIVAFWLATMAALVRLEYFPAPVALETVPTTVVLRKIFANPEPVSMTVFYQGQNIGYCRVRAGRPPESSASLQPHQVDTELRLRMSLLGVPSDMRLVSESRFDERYELADFDVRMHLPEGRVHLSGDRAAGRGRLEITVGDIHEDREFSFAEISNGALAQTLGVPGLATFALPGSSMKRAGRDIVATGPSRLPGATARYDSLRIGEGTLRALLVEYKLDERLWAKIWISEGGELLQVETSLGIKMLDNQLVAAATTGAMPAP